MLHLEKFNEFVVVQSTTMIQTGELELEFTIDGNPDYGHLTVSLRSGETFIAEGGAMAWMSDGMGVKARLLGGFLPALVRKLVGGESLFVGEFSHSTGGQATFSPAVPGEIGHKKTVWGLANSNRRFVYGLYLRH